MKSKQLIILIGVLAAGLVVAYYLNAKRSNVVSKSPAKVGQDVLKGFAPADVSTMSVNDGKNTVEIALKDGKWIVPSRDGFPASVTAVNELRDNAFALRIAEVQKVGESQMGRLKLKEPGSGAPADDTGTLINFKDGGGKDMATVLVGKRLEDKDEGSFSMTPKSPKYQYMKVKGEEGFVYQAKDGFAKLEADPKGWIDKDKFFKVERLKSITVTGTSPEETWKLARETDGGELKLDAPKEGEEFDASKASASGSAFSFPSFDDILPATEKDKAGLDKPTHTTIIESFDGLIYTVKVGAKATNADATDTTERYYMTFSVDGKLDETPPAYAPPMPTLPVELPALPADATEESKKKYEEDKKKYDADKAKYDTDKKAWDDGKKAAEDTFKNTLKTKQEKLAQEQGLKERIFLVQKFVIDPIVKKRTDLMKDKAATPAEGTGAATTPSNGATTPPVSVNPVELTPPTPSGKIEAVTPPIEVTIPDKDGKMPPKIEVKKDADKKDSTKKDGAPKKEDAKKEEGAPKADADKPAAEGAEREKPAKP